LSSKWDAAEINSLISRYEAALPVNGWPNWVLGNHDNPRVRTRIGGKQIWNAAMLLLTLRGTPTMYYGDEIGMGNIKIPKEKVRDPREFNEPGIGVGRDPERTPMQWTDELYGGFSLSESWLPMGGDVANINVRKERESRFSLLSFYRKLIRLRQKEPALYRGDFYPIGVNHQLLAYKRVFEKVEFLICMNLGDSWTTFEPDFKWTGKVEISNNHMLENTVLRNSVSLAGGECLLVRLNGDS
jgi:alpha-glucosidase